MANTTVVDRELDEASYNQLLDAIDYNMSQDPLYKHGVFISSAGYSGEASGDLKRLYTVNDLDRTVIAYQVMAPTQITCGASFDTGVLTAQTDAMKAQEQLISQAAKLIKSFQKDLAETFKINNVSFTAPRPDLERCEDKAYRDEYMKEVIAECNRVLKEFSEVSEFSYEIIGDSGACKVVQREPNHARILQNYVHSDNISEIESMKIGNSRIFSVTLHDNNGLDTTHYYAVSTTKVTDGKRAGTVMELKLGVKETLEKVINACKEMEGAGDSQAAELLTYITAGIDTSFEVKKWNATKAIQQFLSATNLSSEQLALKSAILDYYMERFNNQIC